MSTPPQHPSETKQPPMKPTYDLPDGVAEILAKSLQVGAGTGTCGLLFGATAGIVRGTTPILFSLVTGLQWFGLGSVYYGTRKLAIARHGPGYQITSGQKIEASTIGGAVSGATMGGLLRGPKNILPAAFVFSMLGAGGQFAINKWNSTDVPSAEKQTSWRFNPMKKLTDQEYENILDEKLLVLETEIALLDDNLAELRSQKKEQENAASNQPTSASLTKPRS